MADLVSIDDESGDVLVTGSDGFVGFKSNDGWSSSPSTPLTGAGLAESFRIATPEESSEVLHWGIGNG